MAPGHMVSLGKADVGLGPQQPDFSLFNLVEH